MNEECFRISNVNSKSICVETIDSTTLEIDNCRDSFIYVMKHFDSVIIKHCSETTIFISQASKVTLDRSDDMSFIGFCKSLCVSKSHDINLNLYVNSKPLISEGSFNVTIGPYNAVVSCTKPNGRNFWNHPTIETNASFNLLEPDDFFPFVVPFYDNQNEINAAIPMKYREALAKREKIAENRRKLVLEFCKANPEFADKINEKISCKFNSYLEGSKCGKQINQLGSIEHL